MEPTNEATSFQGAVPALPTDWKELTITPSQRAAILSAIDLGVAPDDIEFIFVNRKGELQAIDSHLGEVAAGGGGVWFWIGRPGSGKSALQAMTRVVAEEKNFVLVRADLTQDRRLSGADGALDLYRQLITSITFEGVESGQALQQIMTKCLAAVGDEDAIEGTPARLESALGTNPLVGDMVRVLDAWATGDDDLRRDALSWLRADIRLRDAAKSLRVRSVVSERNYFGMLKLLARVCRVAGFAGLLVSIDELSALTNLPQEPTRRKNYECLLDIINDTQQRGAPGLAFFFSGTEACLDPKRGLYSLEALRTRLMPHEFSDDGYSDFDAPVIKLAPIATTELYLLCRNVQRVFTACGPARVLIDESGIRTFVDNSLKRLNGASAGVTRELLKNFAGLLRKLDRDPTPSSSDDRGGPHA